MYESHAIIPLVEFEPNREESLINILCSELVLCGFLIQNVLDAGHAPRLRLRQFEYPKVVANTLRTTQAGYGESWQKAQATAPILQERYDRVRAVIKTRPVR